MTITLSADSLEEMLAQFTTAQLREEVARRGFLLTDEREGLQWCEDCVHFNIQPNLTPAAEKRWKPCTKAHRPAFLMPLEHDGPHAPCGFHRPECPDYAEPPGPPEPPPPSPSPSDEFDYEASRRRRGNPDWRPA